MPHFGVLAALLLTRVDKRLLRTIILGYTSFFSVGLSRLRDHLPHRPWFNRKPNYDLKAEVEKILFDGDTMLPVSSDAGRFTCVMSTFFQYEKMVCIQVVYQTDILAQMCVRPSFRIIVKGQKLTW